MLAPVIVFAYNRPDHLSQTLTALAANTYADETTLFIFCDGPKNDASEKQIAAIIETRSVAASKQWCKEVHVVPSDKNKGLADSIISGVTQVISEYGKAIILEDDLITSRFFLKYMNEALNYYDSRKSVFSISANRPSMSRDLIPAYYRYDVFVSLRPFSTGWATWEDRWSQVDWTLDYLNGHMAHPEQMAAFNRGGEDLTNMLLDQKNGKIDSWAIRFAYAHFFNHAIAILPCIPYVDNIGFDGTGTHSGTDSALYRNNVDNAPENPHFLNVLYEDRFIINAFSNVYCSKKRPLLQRICNTIARLFGHKIPFEIKRKVYE